MFRRLVLIFEFYKQFAVSSVLLTVLMLVFGIKWFPAFLVKFLFLGLVFGFFGGTDRKRQLDFYRNLELGPKLLFGSVFVLDLGFLSLVYFVVWFLK